MNDKQLSLLGDKVRRSTVRHPANRFALDYRAEAMKLRQWPFTIIDAHSHINGDRAVQIYADAASLFGVGLTYSMTKLEQIDRVREILGQRIRFITMLPFAAEERSYNDPTVYPRMIEEFYAKGSRILKFWSAPRGIEYGERSGMIDLLRLHGAHRQAAMKHAHGLKMVFMVHVGDPDTWFSTKYRDSSRFGTKRDHYLEFEKLLDRFDNPWIAAHMGGWPEDLEFLTKLLGEHDNLYLDSSATKWIVRELSRHGQDEIVDFLRRWRGRILFGSDIVSSEDHLESRPPSGLTIDEATFDLYASRYYALRTMFESSYRGESPIVDPDLAMVWPERYDQFSAPELVGRALPEDLLEALYCTSAHTLLEPYHRAS